MTQRTGLVPTKAELSVIASRPTTTAPIAASRQIIPSSVDLRPTTFCAPIRDQEQEGSCVAFATRGAVDFYLHKHHIKSLQEASPRDIYWLGRSVDGTTGKDGGETLEGTSFALKWYGVCDELLCPYDESLVSVAPSQDAFKQGKKHKFVMRRIVQNLLYDIQGQPTWILTPDPLTATKSTLTYGYPVIIGVTLWHDSIYAATYANGGRLEEPAPDDKLYGYHALLIVAYDDSEQLFTCQNSWGDKVGDHGYFKLTYAYFLSQTFDWLVIR
jgi:C1A family cysteine protease